MTNFERDFKRAVQRRIDEYQEEKMARAPADIDGVVVAEPKTTNYTPTGRKPGSVISQETLDAIHKKLCHDIGGVTAVPAGVPINRKLLPRPLIGYAIEFHVSVSVITRVLNAIARGTKPDAATHGGWSRVNASKNSTEVDT